MRLFRDLDPLILKEVNQIDRMLVVQAGKLDEIEKKLTLLLAERAYISAELESAIRHVSVLAASIDRKVPDKG
jgi:hypothetical protein